MAIAAVSLQACSGRPDLKAWIFALILLTGILAGGVKGFAADNVIASTPVFGQLVGYRLPAGFVPAFENAGGNNYIQESVLSGETVEDWSQMITLTGARNLADSADRTPVWFANQFGGGFGRNCPETYVATAIQETSVNGKDAFIAYFGCGSVNGVPKPRSEVVTIIFIKSGGDFLTLQWAERGAAVRQPIPLEVDKWKARISQLFPVTICRTSERGC